VIERLLESGAGEHDAASISAALMRAGLSGAAARRWLCGAVSAHPIPWGTVRAGDVTIEGRWGAIGAIEQGGTDAVLWEANAFADLSAGERRISRALLLPAGDVRRMTGGIPARVETTGQILDELKKRVRKDVHVHDVVFALPGVSSTERMVDRIAAGDEDRVLEELRRGAIDVGGLLDAGIVATYGF